MRKTDQLHTRLVSGLKELCLSNMRASYQETAAQAVKASWSYETYLLELVDRECDQRRNRKIDRFLAQSRLPLEKSLEQLQLNRFPQKIRSQVQTLIKGDFLKRQENILIFGNPGSGKTHLLAAISQELIRQGWRVLFSPCSLLVQDLLRAKRDLELKKELKKLSKFHAILIDDIGYVQQSREEMEVLFTLLAERYERGSVMLTSNLPFSKWETIFKDPMTTAAAIDRLVHHSVILELNVPSYRMAKAKSQKTRGEIQP